MKPAASLMLISVVGDTTFDLTVRPHALPRPGGDVPASVSLGLGGQGANVAVRLARRGVRVRLVTALANDAAGRLLGPALVAERVELVAQPSSRSAVVVALLDAHGERAMLSDRVSLEPDAVAQAAEGADWIHASGYLLADDAVGDETARALGSVEPSIRVSVAGGSFRHDAGHSELLHRLRAADPDLLILSFDEACALLGGDQTSPSAAAAALAKELPGRLLAITGGAQGSAAIGHGLQISIPASEPPTMVDATGAGDAYAATLIHGLAGESWPPSASDLEQAMREAGDVGALVCGVLGAQGRVAGELEPLA